MPGSSLWLIPQPSKFNTVAQELISSTIPQLFPSVKTHQFIPHLTLTSSIEASSTYGDQPQKWLDSLNFSDEPVSEDVQICLEAIEPGEPFFKKLTLSAKRDDRLVQLAAACRCYGVENGDMDRARDWAKAEYMPHLSLMYADIEVKEVADRYEAIQRECRTTFDPLADEESVVCTGGKIVLVDTTKPLKDWDVIAARDIPRIRWVWNPTVDQP